MAQKIPLSYSRDILVTGQDLTKEGALVLALSWATKTWKRRILVEYNRYVFPYTMSSIDFLGGARAHRSLDRLLTKIIVVIGPREAHTSVTTNLP